MQRVVDVPALIGSREPPGRALSEDELTAIFRGCREDENRIMGARDGAMLALLYGGLRRSEVAAAALEGLDLDDGTLQVVGKGNKEATIYPPQSTLPFWGHLPLSAWLR